MSRRIIFRIPRDYMFSRQLHFSKLFSISRFLCLMQSLDDLIGGDHFVCNVFIIDERCFLGVGAGSGCGIRHDDDIKTIFNGISGMRLHAQICGHPCHDDRLNAVFPQLNHSVTSPEVARPLCGFMTIVLSSGLSLG